MIETQIREKGKAEFFYSLKYHITFTSSQVTELCTYELIFHVCIIIIMTRKKNIQEEKWQLYCSKMWCHTLLILSLVEKCT